MPAVTDWNQTWIGLSIFALLWLLLFFKGGKKGRVVALLLVPLVFLTDQLSSSFLKMIFMRPRPCHLVDGPQVLENIHLLVPCGSGYSFPSSHAVNNFAFATFMSHHFRKWRWPFLTYAFVMGFSRISVGVHYPSDVAGGALIGWAIALLFIRLWIIMSRIYPQVSPYQQADISPSHSE